ncbi:MAG: hypothetical protein HYS59_01225 [Candidatus Vogelbacteria bacterium]|nr:hypothetical protein [Candidatus Vogelbacteria bacterium]
MDELSKWERLYEEEFALQIDTRALRCPLRHGHFSSSIVVARDVTPDQVYAACKKHFPVSRTYRNLDSDVVLHERRPDSTYVMLVSESEESQVPFEQADGTCITLLEHLLFNLAHFKETGRLLDNKDITACLGSRYIDGRVPTTLSHRGELRIHWCSEHDKYSRLRTRLGLL